MFVQDKKKNPRNTTMFLDILHIVIGAVIVILAVISFLNPEDHMVMFPAIFFAGSGSESHDRRLPYKRRRP